MSSQLDPASAPTPPTPLIPIAASPLPSPEPPFSLLPAAMQTQMGVVRATCAAGDY